MTRFVQQIEMGQWAVETQVRNWGSSKHQDGGHCDGRQQPKGSTGTSGQCTCGALVEVSIRLSMKKQLVRILFYSRTLDGPWRSPFRGTTCICRWQRLRNHPTVVGEILMKSHPEASARPVVEGRLVSPIRSVSAQGVRGQPSSPYRQP